MNKTAIFIIVTLCALLSALAQLLFKLASRVFSFSPINWLNFFFITGFIIYVLVFFIFAWTLKHGNVSMLYPIMASSYVFVFLFSMIFLNEDVSLLNWLGIAFILAGISAIAGKK